MCFDPPVEHKRNVGLTEFKKTLEQFPNAKCIVFIGGEPFAYYKEFIKMLAFSKEKGIKNNINTNGTIIPDEFYTEEIRNTINKITVSVDSDKQDVHNRIRRNPYAFQNALKNIDLLLENKFPVRVQMTISDSNKNDILGMVKFFYNRGVRRFGFHCASLEAADKEVQHIGMYEWRKIIYQLDILFKEIYTDVTEYAMPYIALTKNEFVKYMLDNNENGILAVENKTAHINSKFCPAQTESVCYMYATQGFGFTCPVLNIMGSKSKEYLYDKGTDAYIRNTETLTDLQMIDSSKLVCPAIPWAMHLEENYVDDNGIRFYPICRHYTTENFELIYDNSFAIDRIREDVIKQFKIK
jgi:sulfatase maturation enzyme AslB (radical SAM superfamily)